MAAAAVSHAGYHGSALGVGARGLKGTGKGLGAGEDRTSSPRLARLDRALSDQTAFFL